MNPVRVDVRSHGGSIHENYEEDAVLANARAAYIPGMAPMGGYRFGRYGSCIVKVPCTLHQDYGGELSDDEIRQRVIKHMSAAEYPVIKLDGTIPEWYSITPGTNKITLVWYRESPNCTFNIYRSLYPDEDFELVANVTGTIYGTNTYEDTGLDSNIIYYYRIHAVCSGVENPSSIVRGAKVL